MTIKMECPVTGKKGNSAKYKRNERCPEEKGKPRKNPNITATQP